ncbi:MAG: hypothetical protein OXH69_03475 [Acidobacteria bacterium]|nr:hypothetical protein [Acidobacteriota bacterium]
MQAILVTAAVLIATLFLPAVAPAQEPGEMMPAREALRAAGFELPTAAEREERARRDRRVQRLWSAALIGAGGALGAAVGFSNNKWVIDEGWIGAGIAGTALGFGLYGLFEPLSWRGIEVEPRGVAAIRPYGAGSRPARGAALSVRW